VIPALRRAPLLAAVLLAAGCGPRGDLDSPDPERRAAAVRAIGTRGEGDLPLLLVAQRDGSPSVRRAAAEVFAARGGQASAEALGKLLADPDAGVVATAARGLAAMPTSPRAKAALLAAYANASPAGRAAIADALESIGTSLREAVELEARALWERNLGALGSTHGAERAGAAEEVGASARSEAVARLLPLVDPNRNPDRELAAAAARGLGEAGDWSARRYLETLLGEGDALLSEAAAAALGRLGDPGAADALAGVVADGTGRLAAAVDALAALPQAPEVGVALCELALRSPDPTVAARAARQARQSEAECPERPFLSRLSRPGAEAALAALGELGLQGATAEAVVKRLVPLLDPARTDPSTRAAAASALGKLRNAAAIPAVTQRATALVARITAARARWIPGRLPASAAPGFTPGGEARLDAVIARPPGLVTGAAPPPVPKWIDPLADGDARELAALLGALGRLRAPGAEQLILPLARDPEPAIRIGALEGLSYLATDAAVAEVTRGLEDGAREVRFAAVEALAHLGPRGAPALARAVDAADPGDPGWRVELARALGEAGSGEVVPALTKLLDGASAPAAAAALGRIGAPGATAPLVDWISRPDATGRVEAIEALAQLAALDAAPAIAAQLTSDRPEVRATAARALGRLRHEASSSRLEALRSDYYGRVRRAAVEALSKLPGGVPRMRP
jgi:HEAT repeat protein